MIEIMGKILLYLLTPEDTREAGRTGMAIECITLQKYFPWLGVVKSVFWIVVAMIVPIATPLLISWCF